jgi:hypothetical protein
MGTPKNVVSTETLPAKATDNGHAGGDTNGAARAFPIMDTTAAATTL